jgi:hypothetical protein
VSNIRPGDRSGWRGLDRYNAPQDVPGGYLTEATNLVIEGSGDGGGGRLTLRPGKQNRLAASETGAIKAFAQVVQEDGTRHLWYVTAAGALKRLRPGQTAGDTLTVPAALTGPTPGILVAAGYVYVWDGTHDLARLNIDGTSGETVSGLTRPDAATFAAALTSRTLLDNVGAATWGADTFASVDLVDSAHRDPDTGSITGGSSYYVYSGAGGSLHIDTVDGVNYIRINDDRVDSNNFDAFKQRDPVVLAADAGDFGGDGVRYPKTFGFSCFCRPDPTGTSTSVRIKILVRMYLYSDTGGTTAIGSPRELYLGLVTSLAGQSLVGIFDCRDVSQDIRSVRFEIINERALYCHVQLTHLSLMVLSMLPSFTGADGGGTTGDLAVKRGSVPADTGIGYFGPGVDETPLGTSPRILTSGLRFETEFSPAEDLTSEQKVGVPFRLQVPRRWDRSGCAPTCGTRTTL